MISQTRSNLRTVKSVLIQAATGAGKTKIATDILDKLQERGNFGFFLVHRRELVKQTSEAFREAGLEFGIIASGMTGAIDIAKKIQICSIQTLFNVIKIIESGDSKKLRRNFLFKSLFEHEISDAIFNIRFPSLIVVDEAHHAKSDTWEQVINYYEKSKNIGLSATPKRSDGKGLGDIYEVMVKGPPMRWLIENGYLADYRYYAPGMMDMSGVKHRAGDYDRHEVDTILEKSTVYGNAVKHYRQLAEGKQCIVFCNSIKSSKESMQKFADEGYICAHVDGEMPLKVRDQIIEDYKAKKIKILFSVDLVGEGFNVPGIEVMIDQRPTESLIIYLQHVGRVLRPDDGKPYAIIIDQVGNYLRHGLPDHPHEWELEYTKEKKKKKDDEEVKVKMCDECYHVHAPAPACPQCGFVYPVMSRELAYKEEKELVEVDKTLIRNQQLREQGEAKTLEQLISLGKKRGYKDSWAYRIFNHREQKQELWRALKSQ